MIKAGQILKERRLEKKLTLDDVAKGTKIKLHFLDAIEKGDYNQLPSSSYAQGFVRNYGQFLGFKESQIMPIFRREFDTAKVFNVLPGELGKKDDFSMRQFRFSRPVILIGAIFILLLGYLLFQYRYAFINPPLSVVSPTEGLSIVAQEVTVVGKTDLNSTIFVNNNPVAIDASGNFKKNIDVFTGSTTIKIRSVNRFGKQTEIDRHITVASQ